VSGLARNKKRDADAPTRADWSTDDASDRVTSLNEIRCELAEQTSRGLAVA